MGRPLHPLLRPVACLLSLVAVGCLGGCGRVDPSKAGSELGQDVGQAMAELTRGAIDGGSRILVLENSGIGLPPERQASVTEPQNVFYAALPSGLDLEKVPVGPPAGQPVPEEGLPSDALRHFGFSALAAHPPEVDLIVSFVGEPRLGPKGAAEWSRLPPVVCLSPDGSDLAALMDAGVVVAAIAPRRSAVSAKESKRGQYFNMMYEVVTPDNLSEWAEGG